MSKSFLVLEDGSAYEGVPFGAEAQAYGEVVFSTAMTGYQEMLTDPSYAGQVLVATYPLQGNYGVNEQDFESKKIQVRGFVVRELCPTPSHELSQKTLDQFLKEYGVPGLCGVDTRAITRRLRVRGVMMGVLAHGLSPEEALAILKGRPSYGETDFVREVSTATPYGWPDPPAPRYHIVVLDYGLKHNILRLLARRGCRATAVAATASAKDILALQPDGIVLSPGPGDPALLDYAVPTVKGLIGRKPVLGICLGHQVLAQVFGGKTFKLKFGHRGANQPIKDLRSGRVFITAQNHGYAVDGDSLKGGLEVSQVNLNDGTVEGMAHRDLPVFSIQYHSEASPGPMDNQYIFDKFLEMVSLKPEV